MFHFIHFKIIPPRVSEKTAAVLDHKAIIIKFCVVYNCGGILPEVITGDADDYVEVSESVETVGVAEADPVDVPDSPVASEEATETAPDLIEEGAPLEESEKSNDG